MKICVVAQQFGRRWSGLGTYATNLVEGLIARGISPVVVCPEGMGEGANARIVPVRMAGWEKAVNYWLPLAWEFRGALRRLLAKESFDVIHFTDAREALFSAPGSLLRIGTMNDYYAASSPANPLYFRRHYSDWPVRFPYYRFMRAVEPIALRKLDAVIANSNYVRDILINNYSITPQNIHVINYGIDLPGESNALEKLEGDPSILFVGANFQRKGLPDLLRAAAIAREELKGLVIHVVGEDSKKRVMRDLAAQLGLDAAVRFRGLVNNDEVRRMMADMFVMPSLIEGFGIVFLEAMHTGIPVIGGRVGGTVELIQDGKNGFTVAPGDVEGLARKIVQLAVDKKVRKIFIEAGKRTAQEYTIEKMINSTIELYNSLVAVKR